MRFDTDQSMKRLITSVLATTVMGFSLESYGGERFYQQNGYIYGCWTTDDCCNGYLQELLQMERAQMADALRHEHASVSADLLDAVTSNVPFIHSIFTEIDFMKKMSFDMSFFCRDPRVPAREAIKAEYQFNAPSYLNLGVGQVSVKGVYHIKCVHGLHDRIILYVSVDQILHEKGACVLRDFVVERRIFAEAGLQDFDLTQFHNKGMISIVTQHDLNEYTRVLRAFMLQEMPVRLTAMLELESQEGESSTAAIASYHANQGSNSALDFSQYSLHDLSLRFFLSPSYKF